MATETINNIIKNIENNSIKNIENNSINETNIAYRFNIVKRIRNIKYEELKKLINKTNNKNEK